MNQPDPADLNEPFGDSEQLPPAGAQPAEPMTGDLLPCPFCGKSNQDRYPCEWLDSSGANVVRCAWCHGAAPMSVWNRRTPSPSAPVGLPKVPVPTDVMEARAQGRAEALAIVLGLEAETVLDELIQSIPTDPTGEWGCAWDEAKLREMFRADDTAWSLLQEAEGEYWHNLGLREEAQHLAQQPEAVDEAMVERVAKAMHNSENKNLGFTWEDCTPIEIEGWTELAKVALTAQQGGA